jgi:Flp pilus assembly pilin Flp
MRRIGRARRRGAVLVEYALLLVAVGVPTLAGLMYGGTQMYQNYLTARESMLSPFP